MADYPEDLRYSSEHEWVRPGDGPSVRVGVSEYATNALGDIVYVSLPVVGSEVVAGDSCGELESTKSVSDLFSPVSGVVTAVNEAITENPDTLNVDPYKEGWLFEVELSDPGQVDQLMDADSYQASLTD